MSSEFSEFYFEFCLLSKIDFFSAGNTKLELQAYFDNVEQFDMPCFHKVTLVNWYFLQRLLHFSAVLRLRVRTQNASVHFFFPRTRHK